MVYIRKIIETENEKRQQRVRTEFSDHDVVVDYDYFETGELVFELPAGSIVAQPLVDQFGLERVTEDIDGKNMLTRDAFIRVSSVYPTAPYKPGARQTVKLLVNQSGDNGVAYADLLGVEYYIDDSKEIDLVEDDFDLDDEDEQAEPYFDLGDLDQIDCENMQKQDNLEKIEDGVFEIEFEDYTFHGVEVDFLNADSIKENEPTDNETVE